MTTQEIDNNAKLIAEHIIEKSNTFDLYTEPYKHGIIDNFLPEFFYNEIDRNFPDYNTKNFKREQYYYPELDSKFWNDKKCFDKSESMKNKLIDIANNFFSEHKIDKNTADIARAGRISRSLFEKDNQSVTEKTLATVFESYGKDIIRSFFKKFNIKFPVPYATWSCAYVWNLAQDTPVACIEPHLDVPSKILSFVLYLPQNNTKIPGTDILEQKGDGTFNIVRTADGNKNSCMVFERSQKSWHQARPTSVNRRTIAFFIVNKSYTKNGYLNS